MTKIDFDIDNSVISTPIYIILLIALEFNLK